MRCDDDGGGGDSNNNDGARVAVNGSGNGVQVALNQDRLVVPNIVSSLFLLLSGESL